jgi:hypothetical protein
MIDGAILSGRPWFWGLEKFSVCLPMVTASPSVSQCALMGCSLTKVPFSL